MSGEDGTVGASDEGLRGPLGRGRRRRRRFDPDAEPDDGLTGEQRADRLKERIYITFTALAVVLAIASHASEVEAADAALTLLVTVGGAVLAVFAADVIAHIAVHRVLPTRVEAQHMFAVSFGALATLVLPMAFLVFAMLGRWTVEAALRASTIALIVSLAAIGWLAVRRVRLAWWQRLIVLLLEVALGVAVVGLELLAHSL
ncbi:hypothetical protein NY547_01050 [Cnuibacter physcomitrellae]|uniref:hypothetical protein n=1 Tax=Cnuibacter physcomitrellae TaxID=1619308 RepID=UPI001966A561|nr:hypothetical protein [Cnuibacter physcomitrellae]MCS5495826.1 hypothetical protein [Cnuibacter physcomitrellae]